MRRLCAAVFAAVFTVGTIIPNLAFAQQNPDEYFKLLGITKKFLNDQKVKGIVSGGAESAVAVLGLSRRFYEAGETWKVSFTPSDELDRINNGDPQDYVSVPFKATLFEFKVLKVDSDRVATIEVRQAKNGAPVDARVDHVVLKINDQFHIVSKQVIYRDAHPSVTLLSNGQENISTGFTAYPIELPNIASTVGVPLKDVPKELKSDVKGALDFQTQDLYARTIRTIWRDGDVWPLYVKNSAGVSMLLSQSRQR